MTVELKRERIDRYRRSIIELAELLGGHQHDIRPLPDFETRQQFPQPGIRPNITEDDPYPFSSLLRSVYVQILSVCEGTEAFELLTPMPDPIDLHFGPDLRLAGL